ncbi:SDR family oxidoreductase [Amycolatopsis sp. FDAARGOS 1241]|nr:SDR family oxidoreductase [Amycolatopsis sp. FDAARGOS 1241]QRP42729.1 SDR family oxidoreductase [Amycolatopsis sp. FDAARGOS 1241]
MNIGSMWARQGIAASPHTGYSVQKGGVHSFTKALAIESAPHGIEFNAVAPAVVKTALYLNIVRAEQLDEAVDSFAAIPAGAGWHHGGHHERGVVPPRRQVELADRRHRRWRRRCHRRPRVRCVATKAQNQIAVVIFFPDEGGTCRPWIWQEQEKH